MICPYWTQDKKKNTSKCEKIDCRHRMSKILTHGKGGRKKFKQNVATVKKGYERVIHNTTSTPKTKGSYEKLHKK